MAKWGEGDPRWIVEDRADGTNVDNWHWTEKNASGWSKEKLKNLLDGFIIEDDIYFCEIKELTKIEGEASANNRKAKLIFFYEWVLTAEWIGKLKRSNTSIKGKMECPNLSDENDPEDLDISFTTTNTSDDGAKVKDFLRVQGAEKIREQLALYIHHLKEEFGQGMILPSKTNGLAKAKEPSPVKNEKKETMNKPILSAVKNMGLGVQIKCRKLTDRQEFKCRASELYRAFTEPQMVRAFSQGECELDATQGGRFSMFQGNVVGEFIELDLNNKISMKWRFKSWPAEHYSNVIMVFEEKEDCTVLTLTQTGVPESEYDRTKEGWTRYYWQSIKSCFGFGANLF